MLKKISTYITVLLLVIISTINVKAFDDVEDEIFSIAEKYENIEIRTNTGNNQNTRDYIKIDSLDDFDDILNNFSTINLDNESETQGYPDISRIKNKNVANRATYYFNDQATGSHNIEPFIKINGKIINLQSIIKGVLR